jgi:hypothetical protein
MSKTITTALLALLLGAATFAGAAAGAGEACLKRVFDRYCLGGDLGALLRQAPQPLFQQTDGERRAAVYLDGRERVYVLAFRDRIYKVLRQHRPATHLRYQELASLLGEKYGRPEDRSLFPSYADSRSARVVAIRRGEGRAEQLWRPEPGWRVELSWTREMGVAVSYIAEQLDAQQRQVMERGY